MSAEASILTRSWTVGTRTVTFAMPRPSGGRAVHAVIVWDPEVPRRLSQVEQQQYCDGRDAALREIAAELGINAAVLEF